MKNKLTIRNIMHVLFILGIICLYLIGSIDFSTITFETLSKNFSVSTFLSNLIIPLITYVGLLDILYYINLQILLPEFYLDQKKNIEQKNNMVDIASLLNLTVDEIRLLLKLNERQYEETLLVKTGKENILTEYKKRIDYFLSNSKIVIPANKLKNPSLKNITYFINFMDIMHNTQCYGYLVKTMSNYIRYELTRSDLEKVSHILVPYKGNYMFGDGVARELNKKIVHVIKDIQDYHLDRHFEGIIDQSNFNQENCIIIHDVLYTGAQILESCQILDYELNTIKRDSYHFHLFTLCSRNSKIKEEHGIEILKSKNFIVHSINQYDDKDIEAILAKNKSNDGE
ncbi:hypothetical protein AGMMS50212_11620 [Spirochaetia bacterium]|nr:hypothetical protein AGMMS50212_11620 [Spirochaetia bacterium]